VSIISQVFLTKIRCNVTGRFSN